MAVPTVDDLRQMLRGVVDPELGADIVDLGMVKDISVDRNGDVGDVTVWVDLTIGGCPLQVQIRDDIRAKLRGSPGVGDVTVRFGEMDQAQRSAVMQRARRRATERAGATEVPLTTRVLAIASGKGGVGKSSVTVNLASAMAQRGLTVGVLDADIWGFSVPRMLGVSGRLGASDDGLIRPHEIQVGPGRIKVVSMGFLVDDEDLAIMWRGLMLAKAVEEFLVKVAWGSAEGPALTKSQNPPAVAGPAAPKQTRGEMDYLLLDMPPGTGDVQLALARVLPRTEIVVVTTPALAAQKVAVRAADMARRSYLKVLGVIENMSTFTCDHGESYPLFGVGGGQALADDLGIPLIGSVPLEPAVSLANDSGKPLSVAAPQSAAGAAFRAIADRIVDELLPPIDMAGCSARLLAAAEAALG